MERKKIENFTDLDAWREAYKLTLMIYKITKKFPKDETFGIVSQMRRCAVSIASNIAEGFSRQSGKEKIQFYYISQGSNTELQNQIYISNGIEYIDKEQLKELINQLRIVHKLTTGLIRSCKKHYT